MKYKQTLVTFQSEGTYFSLVRKNGQIQWHLTNTSWATVSYYPSYPTSQNEYTKSLNVEILVHCFVLRRSSAWMDNFMLEAQWGCTSQHDVSTKCQQCLAQTFPPFDCSTTSLSQLTWKIFISPVTGLESSSMSAAKQQFIIKQNIRGERERSPPLP